MEHKNSATYWVDAVGRAGNAANVCRPEDKPDYQKAVRFAKKKLRSIRQRAGIFIK